MVNSISDYILVIYDIELWPWELFSYFSDNKIAFDLKTMSLLIRKMLMQF